MAVVQKKTRIPAQQQGVSVETLTIDIAAGADGSTAFVFTRPFAAVPKVIGLVRQDATGIDVACVPSVASLTALGGTLRHKGTSTVIMTYTMTVVGDYINPTAY